MLCLFLRIWPFLRTGRHVLPILKNGCPFSRIVNKDELQNMTEKCEQLESLVKEKDAMIGQLQKQIELIKYARDESCLKCKGDKRKGNDLNDEKLEGDRSEEIYTIGDKVWTYYSPDKRSYPAKILEVIDDKYTVEYTEDKARITVDGENLRFGTKRRR